MCLFHLHLPPLLLITWCKLHHLPLLHLPPVRAVHPPRAPVSGGVVPAMCQPPAATGPPASGLCYSPLNATAPSDTPLPPFLSAFNTPDYWCARHTWLRVLKEVPLKLEIFSLGYIYQGHVLGKWMDGWMSLMPRFTAAGALRELISVKWHDAS